MRKISSSAISVTRDERIDSAPSSKGNQIKWRTRNGLWLKADDFGYEGLSEAVAARFLELSNISQYAWYDTCTIKEDIVEYRGCVSRDFLESDERLITIFRLYEANGIDLYSEFEGKSAVDKLNRLIDNIARWTNLAEFGAWLGRLLEFDAFILNEDRHLQNIAVISNTGGGFRLMPIFDNGAALLSDTRRDYPLSASVSKLIEKVRSKPIVTSFSRQIEATNSAVGLSLEFTCRPSLDHNDFPQYTEEEINRAEKVVEIQTKRYSYLFEN